MLLSCGRTLFDGPARDISTHLSACDLPPCPPDTSLADHLLYLTATAHDALADNARLGRRRRLVAEADSAEESAVSSDVGGRRGRLLDWSKGRLLAGTSGWSSSSLPRAAKGEGEEGAALDDEALAPLAPPPNPGRGGCGGWKQCRLLTWRTCVHLARHPTLLRTQVTRAGRAAPLGTLARELRHAHLTRAHQAPHKTPDPQLQRPLRSSQSPRTRTPPSTPRPTPSSAPTRPRPNMPPPQLSISIAMGMVLGAAFWSVKSDAAGFQNKAGGFYTLLIFFGFGGLSALGVVAAEWRLFWREWHAGLVDAWAYVLVKNAVELLLLRVLPSLVLGAIVYIMMGLRPEVRQPPTRHWVLATASSALRPPWPSPPQPRRCPSLCPDLEPFEEGRPHCDALNRPRRHRCGH